MTIPQFFPNIEYYSFVAYFEGKPQGLDEVLGRCSEILRNLFGDLKVTIYYTDIARKPNTTGIPTSELAETSEHSLSEGLTGRWNIGVLQSMELPHFIAWASSPDARKFVRYGFEEDIFALEYHHDPVTNGQHVGPFLRVSINLARVDEAKQEALSDAARRLAAIVDSTGVFCSGLCDISPVLETCLGKYYTGTNVSWLSFQRQASRLVWVRAGEGRRYKARGIFWGNLFGPSIVERLGGADAFGEEYERLEDRRDYDLISRQRDGSLLVTLCKSVGDFRFPFRKLMPPTLERAAWLYERLCEAKLMCGT